MNWIHFEYTSGCNPYIAFTEKEKKRILRKYRKQGIKVTMIDTDFYVIDDKED